MKHSGGCHCGKVRYEVEMNLESAISCNCSICFKRGSLLAFAPASHFKQISGEADLTEYLFNKHVIRHLFCKVCGILSFGRAIAPDKTDTVAINIRTLDHVDLSTVKIQEYDGRSK
jgi:hypothetical protein